MLHPTHTLSPLQVAWWLCRSPSCPPRLTVTTPYGEPSWVPLCSGPNHQKVLLAPLLLLPILIGTLLLQPLLAGALGKPQDKTPHPSGAPTGTHLPPSPSIMALQTPQRLPVGRPANLIPAPGPWHVPHYKLFPDSFRSHPRCALLTEASLATSKCYITLFIFFTPHTD